MEKEYTVSFVDNKTSDWKILTLEIVDGDGSSIFEDVSVNRVNKKGETFPGFDDIKVGSRVKGNLWVSPQGKHYLYAPRPKTLNLGANTRPQGGFKANIKEAQEVKREGIKLAQENKELGIKISSTIRMAVDLTIASLGESSIIDEGVMKSKIKEWRAWLWETWEDPNDNPIYPQ